MNSVSSLIKILILTIYLCSCATQKNKDEMEVSADLFETERLAISTYEDGNYEESRKYYSILVKQIPQEKQYWFRLANVYARTKRFDAAVLAYREALVRDPGFTKAWYNMGIVQLRRSVNSFVEMQLYSDKSDPLYGMSKDLVNGILELLNEDPTE